MEKHIFYQKYANIPLPLRNEVFQYPKEEFSPNVLYEEIRKQEVIIKKANQRIAYLLSIADKFIK